ncbi:eukaryotic translation initiation factor 3 subunit F [Cryptococcus floricola]|uniref:Eukaryotic translation initiation factor 3 subunit F n=1 Tax=Cryptococcus floricola TaxID=2591691 RepID=A0A5D3B7X0_9TREE|nr:eukaryotic translation initiation factor 3 subunit F [Cryptococcus floricola]
MSLTTSSSAIHLSLPPTSSTRPPSQITVHPSVVASILTHHSRRPTDSESTRVIGALMGTRSDNGQEVDIRSCFAVPHTEQGQQISVDQPFQQEMLQFLSKNGTKEVLVGWYASSKHIDSNSAIIQEYFTSQTNNQPAVHLTVDTDLQENGQGLEVKGWVSALLGLSAKSESAVFVPVPVSVKYADSERPALDLLTSNPTPSPSLPPLPTLSSSLAQLSSLIDQCLAYVQGVNAGTTPADVQVGKYLLEGLGRWAANGEKEDEGGVKAGLQDTLTVEYLSSLVRSQVELAGRLSLLQQQPSQ